MPQQTAYDFASAMSPFCVPLFRFHCHISQHFYSKSTAANARPTPNHLPTWRKLVGRWTAHSNSAGTMWTCHTTTFIGGPILKVTSIPTCRIVTTVFQPLQALQQQVLNKLLLPGQVEVRITKYPAHSSGRKRFAPAWNF